MRILLLAICASFLLVGCPKNGEKPTSTEVKKPETPTAPATPATPAAPETEKK